MSKPNPSQRLEYCRRLHRLWQQIQRQNRFVGTAPQSDLGLLESHILLELHARPRMRLGQLAALLQCDQGNLSRTIDKLERRRLVRSSADSVSRRLRLLSVTSPAASRLQKIDQFADRQLERSLSKLVEQEKDLVIKLYSLVADNLGSPLTTPRPSEHFFRPLQRRLTRALGLLGESLFQSSLSSTSLQVLSLLASTPFALTPKGLAAALALKPSTLSGILRSFEKRKLIKRVYDPNDRRSVLLSPTDEGKRLLSDIEWKSAARLATALAGVSAKELSKFAGALDHYVQAGELQNEDGKFELRRVAGESAELRAFMARHLVRLGRESKLPACLCGPRSITYVFPAGSEPQASVHFTCEGGGGKTNLFCMVGRTRSCCASLLDRPNRSRASKPLLES